MTDGNGGEITVGGRFGRIESSLDRIESKLDVKVNMEEILRLETRISTMESGESPAGKMFLERFHKMEGDLNDISRHGSSQAQEAIKEVAALESKVETLREENVRYSTLQSQKVNDAMSRNRYWTVALSAANGLVLVANLIIGIVLHVH